MDEIILEYRNIEKRFFGVQVLNDVSFTLKKGHILGLVGENGAGKSTLMNILGGVFPPDGGSIRFCGKAYTPKDPSDAFSQGIAFIHQELNLFSNLSVADNIFIHDYPCKRGFPWIDSRKIYDKTINFLDTVNLRVSPDTLVEDLSPGERQLVEIAKALGLDARIVIFDEPTTSLSTQEVERLFTLIERLHSQGISMIYISHVLGDVLQLCDEIVVLRDGEVAGRGEKTGFTLQKIISQMVGGEISQLYPARSSVRSDKVLLEVRSLSHPDIVHNIDFTLNRGEILGLTGLMGSGRTELARMLFGLDVHKQGRILLNGKEITGKSIRSRIKSGLAFLTEDRRSEGILMEASIADNIALASLPSVLGFVSDERSAENVNKIAETVCLRCESVKQSAKTLSGGNQQKVVLAKWLVRQPPVLILDEPTRGIDVGAKYEIYKIMDDITANGGGVLFISSEIEELIGMCDRILVMSGGEIVDAMARQEFSREEILRSALGETKRV